MQKRKAIIWDWNGTLLNDIHICVDAINQVLKERNKAGIDMNRYREIFTFPVRDYYVRAGFDFSAEPFEKPAIEFMERYQQLVAGAGLFDDVVETLDSFSKKGYDQMILSAMQQDLLLKLVESHAIDHYFSNISGIGDHYATEKITVGKQLIAGLDGKHSDITLVGDTIHDHEVGQALGVEVILVASGHQSEERLSETGRKVVGRLSDLKTIL